MKWQYWLVISQGCLFVSECLTFWRSVKAERRCNDLALTMRHYEFLAEQRLAGNLVWKDRPQPEGPDPSKRLPQ